MKYVIVNLSGLATAILFPDHINHCDAISPKVPPIGAGFCHLCAHGSVCVYGESTSLGFKASPADAKAIAHTLMVMGLGSKPTPFSEALWAQYRGNEESRAPHSALDPMTASGPTAEVRP